MDVTVRVGPAAMDKLLADARSDRKTVYWLENNHGFIIGPLYADPLIIYQRKESFSG